MSAARIRTVLIAALASLGLAGCIVIVDDGGRDRDDDDRSRRLTTASEQGGF